jgi:hypothetical protein
LTVNVWQAPIVLKLNWGSNHLLRPLEAAVKRIAVAAVCAGLCGLALLIARYAPAQQQDQAAKDHAAKIKALQKERIDVLSQAVKILEVQYRTGVVDFQQYAAAVMDLIGAQLEYSDVPEERIARLEENCKAAKAAMEFVEARVRSGYRASEIDLCRLKALYLDVQIKLLKERQKLVASKGK